MTIAPIVSIILPTYNRARFLPLALRSIRAQLFTDWELIIVDDGSTDDTPPLIPELTAGMHQPVKLIRQKNQGAYGARNTGLNDATGRYIAFFDSDDEWLPHHLQDCVAALDSNDDVDWVYGACQIIDDLTGEIRCGNTFHREQPEFSFTKFAVRHRGPLHVIVEPDLAVKIFHGTGLYAGLQNSLIRGTMFSSFRFDTKLRNEAEDQVFVMLAALSGKTFGYLDSVHVRYRVHHDNSSGSAIGQSLEKQHRLYEAVAHGFEQISSRATLTRRQQRALNHLVSREYFWHLGYNTLMPMGDRKRGYAAYRKAIRLRPCHLPYWKTYLVSCLRELWAFR